jgi:hypothetical protein
VWPLRGCSQVSAIEKLLSAFIQPLQVIDERGRPASA